MAKVSDSIDIVQFRSLDLEAPNILIGLPDVGLVGEIAVSYVIDKMKMEELGYIDSQKFPPLVIIKESVIKNPIRIYGKGNILAIISDLPFPTFIINPFFKSLLTWIENLKPNAVIGITGLPAYDRMHINKPSISAIATTAKARDLLDQAGVRLLSDGIFSGIYAGLIKECNIQNVSNITLLAESYLNFPDPAAAVEVLDVVSKILNISIDLKQLEEEAERIKISMRELMLLTEKALEESQKLHEGKTEAIYR